MRSPRTPSRPPSGSAIPVVVKPLDAQPRPRRVDRPQDRRAGARSRSRRRASTRAASIVETFLEGNDHRMLVVDGELVAVAKRVPGHVVGDGDAHDRRAGRHRQQPIRGAASATRRCSRASSSTHQARAPAERSRA